MKLFKLLTAGNTSTFQDFAWPIPNGRPGKWLPKIDGDLAVCERGYHLMRATDLLEWQGECLYEAEHKGEIIESDDKVVVRQARLIRKVETWNDKTLRLFACDCADRVLHLFEKKYPGDTRPRLSIEAARRFANGEGTREEMDAAWDAARDAAWAAAWDAARDAAWAAAGAAAGAAECKWQIARFIELLGI